MLSDIDIKNLSVKIHSNSLRQHRIPKKAPEEWGHVHIFVQS